MFHSRSQTTGRPNIDLNGISLRALQVFATVAETGSLTAAGARLGGSRSAVSQQITHLEKAVGAMLIDRSSRPVSLTGAGTVLLRHARRVLQIVTETQTELMELSLASPLELRLGVIDDLDASLTPDLVGDIQQHYPRCQLTVTSGRSDALGDALARRAVDLIVTGVVPSPASEFQDHRILREPFMLVASRGVFDAAGDLLQQMQSHPFVRYNAAMPIGMMIAQHLRRLRIELPAPYSFDATRSVITMVEKCRGWTITTPLCVLDARQDVQPLDCLRLPFAGFERTISVATRRDELGALPRHIADRVRLLVLRRLVPEARQLAGWLESEFEVLGSDSASFSPARASARAADGS